MAYALRADASYRKSDYLYHHCEDETEVRMQNNQIKCLGIWPRAETRIGRG